MFERGASGGEEAVPLVGLELLGLRNGRELGSVENFVGVGVTDAAEGARVGKCAFQSVILFGKHRAEAGEVSRENVDASCVQGLQILRTADEVERRAALGPSLCEGEGAVREIKRREILPSSEFARRGTPMEPARDHEMKHKPEVAVDADGDALTDAPEFANGAAFEFGLGRVDRAEQEGIAQADVLEGLADHAGLESVDVGHDVGQLGHFSRMRRGNRICKWRDVFGGN